MNTIHIADSEWDKMRDKLASTILLRKATELYFGNLEQDGSELDDISTVALGQITDAVRWLAAERMGEIGIMPESCREDAA